MSYLGRLRIYKRVRRGKRRYKSRWLQAIVLLPSDRETIEELKIYDEKEVAVIVDWEKAKLECVKLKMSVSRYIRALSILDRLLAHIPTSVLEEFQREHPEEINFLIDVFRELKCDESFFCKLISLITKKQQS